MIEMNQFSSKLYQFTRRTMNTQFNNRSYNMIKKTTLCFNETVHINLPIFLLLRLVNVVAVLAVVLYYTVTLSVFCIFRTRYHPTTERSLWGLEEAVSTSPPRTDVMDTGLTLPAAC